MLTATILAALSVLASKASAAPLESRQELEITFTNSFPSVIWYPDGHLDLTWQGANGPYDVFAQFIWNGDTQYERVFIAQNITEQSACFDSKNYSQFNPEWNEDDVHVFFGVYVTIEEEGSFVNSNTIPFEFHGEGVEP